MMLASHNTNHGPRIIGHRVVKKGSMYYHRSLWLGVKMVNWH